MNNSNYFLNLEILNRIGGNTMSYMKDKAQEIEDKNNEWLEEEGENEENS